MNCIFHRICPFHRDCPIYRLNFVHNTLYLICGSFVILAKCVFTYIFSLISLDRVLNTFINIFEETNLALLIFFFLLSVHWALVSSLFQSFYFWGVSTVVPLLVSGYKSLDHYFFNISSLLTSPCKAICYTVSIALPSLPQIFSSKYFLISIPTYWVYRLFRSGLLIF